MRKRILPILLCLVMGIALLYPSASAGAVATNVKIAVNINMPPYQFLDEYGNCVGIHIDIFNSIAESQNLQVTYIPFANDIETMDALQAGDVDAILGAKTQFPSKYGFRQTGELSSSSLCLVAPNAIAKEISDNDYPYYYYTMATDYLTHLIIGWAHLDQSDFGLTMRRITANPFKTFELLKNGKVQIAAMDKESIVYYLEDANLSDDYTIINNHLMTTGNTILVRSNDNILQQTLEKGLSDLRLSGNYQRIRDKWIKDTAADVVKKTALAVGMVLGVAMTFIIIILYINRMLKLRVAEKTRELQQVNDELSQRMTQLQQEQYLRNGLIENSPSGMVMFDDGYVIRLINRRAQQISDYSDNAGVGGNIRELKVFGEILSGINTNIFSAGGLLIKGPRIVTLNDAGEKKDYRYVIYSPLSHGKTRNVLMVTEDVTLEEKRRQAKQEEEKNKVLNILIAGIAHEIKNPLMTIQTYTSTISQQINNPEYLASFERNVPQEVRRINRLVEALINYARPVKGEHERLDLAAIVNDSLYLTRASIRNKRISMELEMENGIYILANRDKMKQTIINIVANSLDSINQKLQNDGNGTDVLFVEIWTERQGRRVELHIRDTGIGMTEAEIHRCTEPFFTTKRTGTGLGMSLAKQFVQDNNGILKIESEKGLYTEITLSFWEVCQN